MAETHWHAPDEVRVTSGGGALTLAWADGAAMVIEARELRWSCRCAGCTAERETGGSPPVTETIAITGVETIGGYALNIAFSDGHARGVYPWAYLREFAKR